ncbi:S53 family peptidase [Aneurinibacillus sp. Ricciae_BoGa-3]|uniref:S53 family peptidase n=1 Tax=Aneurinibacillus sp. Ricciae_BoGa-3 TaxID=3022697 RepID=UPI002341AAC4|nr:S53 family peptidase [Aneurinibacillus sp. Ricciae_BoGa-3]WCK53294.1 S53 family peptidase [Aneurinibacillus sp. Ricciae_BoGa-3]
MDKETRALSGQEQCHLVHIPGSDRTVLPNARKSGPVDPNETMSVTVLLRRPSPKNTGTSPKRHLSPEQFVATYSVDPNELKKMQDFIQKHNLTIKEVNDAAGTMILTGTVASFNQAFGVELEKYEHPEFTYRGRTGHVYIPQELADIVEAVLGLDNRPQLKPKFQIFEEKDEFAVANKARLSYTPPQITQVYNFPTDIDCSEQCIGIIELGGGYNQAEMQQYFSSLGIVQPEIKDVSVDGAVNQPTGDPNGADGEVVLDIEVAGSVSPGVKLAVYFAPNTDAGFLNAINKAVHDSVNKPTVISISWGNAESQWTNQAMQAMDRAFQDAAVVGVTICCASGDRGSADGVDDGRVHVDFPASSPFALACGGTHLEGSGSTIKQEVVWNDGPDSSTGGGVSEVFDLPDWQSRAHVSVSANLEHRKGRGVPDVAGDADPATGYRILVDGKQAVFGGTSAVAPLWAGLLTLINAQLGRPVGFVNPMLYNLPVRGNVFRDIKRGNNESTRQSEAYLAHPGWDPCTGLGSPDGVKLTDALKA